jgi:hypothetical protein
VNEQQFSFYTIFFITFPREKKKRRRRVLRRRTPLLLLLLTGDMKILKLIKCTNLFYAHGTRLRLFSPPSTHPWETNSKAGQTPADRRIHSFGKHLMTEFITSCALNDNPFALDSLAFFPLHIQ